jgi:hypothetical protein
MGRVLYEFLEFWTTTLYVQKQCYTCTRGRYPPSGYVRAYFSANIWTTAEIQLNFAAAIFANQQ